MTTMPPDRAPAPIAQAHRHRQMAKSFGVDAERYDRTRPPYPPALIEKIAATAPGPEILDVGCGTGIVARQLRAAGRSVLGVEPDARMAEFARGTGIEVDVATFEAWEPAGRRFDAVVAGTAWHWVDPVAGAAKAGRVLRPGGLLAVFWHAFRLPDEITDVFVEVFHRVVPDSPFDYRSMPRDLDPYQTLCIRAADAIRETGTFAEPEQWRFEWEMAYTRDAWLDQLPTQGSMTRLRPDQITEIQREVGAAIDGLGGSFTMPYSTTVVAAVTAA